MDTIENNTLIAKFMGFKNGTFGSITYEKYGSTWDIVESFMPEEFKYHSDWNWLMEVVDKIESVEIGGNISISGLNIFLHYPNRIKPLFRVDGEKENITKMEAVYSACIEFIKWYNQQKQ